MDVNITVGTGNDNLTGGDGAVYEIRWGASPMGAVGGGSSTFSCGGGVTVPPFSTTITLSGLERWPEGVIKDGALNGFLHDEDFDDGSRDRIVKSWTVDVEWHLHAGNPR